MLKKPVGLQLWTLRDEIAKDFKGTLEQVAKIGYKAVEIGDDTGGMDAAELRKFMDGLGIAIISRHVLYPHLEGDLGPVVEFAHTAGMKFVVCPWANAERAGDWLTIAKTLEKAGAKLKEAGLQLCYHNHSHEFKKYDGHYAFDILYANSKPDLVMAEIDTYWVKAGGEEPQDYIRKYAGRVPLIHLKDMTKGPNPTFAEVGDGVLNWTEICSAADEAGAKWYLVEQDSCQRPPLESVKISIENLRKMGVVQV